MASASTHNKTVTSYAVTCASPRVTQAVTGGGGEAPQACSRPRPRGHSMGAGEQGHDVILLISMDDFNLSANNAPKANLVPSQTAG